MIIGIGSDLADKRRFQRLLARHAQRLPRHILTADEIALLSRSVQPAAFVASRWAAKEALGKACGCGLRAPLNWRQSSVLNDAKGKPYFHFSAAAAAFVKKMGAAHCHLTLSHDGDYALAVVILEGNR